MLRPKKHITRQKIKEDKFVTKTLNTANWVKNNQGRLTTGVIAALIVAVVFWGYTSARDAAEREASLLTLQGGYALETGNLELAREILLDAVELHGGSKSAGRATLMLGHLFFRLGAIDTSQIYYELFLDKYARDDLLRVSARAGIAACFEQQEEYGEAARIYEESVDDSRDHPKAAHYLLQAGRCYKLAELNQQAKLVYERIKVEYPAAAEADRAAFELAQLARQGG